MSKVKDDSWSTSPPQVTSYLAVSRSQFNVAVYSGSCGFGWRFRFEFTRTSSSPELFRVDISFEPHLCDSMPLRIQSIKVTAFCVESNCSTKFTPDFGSFCSFSFKTISVIGSYYARRRHLTHVTITVAFDKDDNLSLPTTSPISNVTSSASSLAANGKKALHTSLDGPSFFDTKFYLYSSRVHNRPAIPKEVFGNSRLLGDSSAYIRDLLSDEDFSSGTQCNIYQRVPEELGKLNPGSYDYELDSDLEDVDGDEEGHESDYSSHDATAVDHEEHTTNDFQDDDGKSGLSSQTPVPLAPQGKAYAINGTAYQTWKAFIFYTYTNEIYFSPLKSQRRITTLVDMGDDGPKVTCSAKSMYRFADYAGVASLKQLARDGIQQRLDEENIITELFSLFTSRYQEIIEMEVEFLIQNLTSNAARDFDIMLQMGLAGRRPVCHRTLAFTIRRLRGESSSTAWKALDELDNRKYDLICTCKVCNRTNMRIHTDSTK